MFSLGASLDLIKEAGLDNIQTRALELNRYLTARFDEAGFEVLSPLRNEDIRSTETLVAVEQPHEVVRRLFARGVIVTEKPEGIRVATHFFNNEGDVERLIGGLEELQRQKIR
jgi:selenocysteine lyase/cysteine desulfurase